MKPCLLPMRQKSNKYKLDKFIDAMRQMNDCRDKRGKRHTLSFVLCGVTLAILTGRATLSSIQRYMVNRLQWLREVTGETDALAVSRAQLPRILSGLDRPALNAITMKHFGIHLIETNEGEWKAIDGKTLCGTPDENGSQRTRIVTAVDHASRETEAQCELNSTKKGEITVVRTFLHETGLEKANVTLDALHLNPTTTAQIEQAGGHYIIQAKRNQAELCDTLTTVAHTSAPLAILNCLEQGHGRQEERWAWFFDLTDVPLEQRWQESGLHTLAVVLRQTTQPAKATLAPKISLELSYYLSNYSLSAAHPVQPQSLFQAIRRHWGVESVNWIRDVTFQEDQVNTKDTHLAQLLASLRSFAIRLLQRARFPNFQAALEQFSDCPDAFLSFLHDAQIL
jgi:predicted transposase YbfD/YdcC